MERIFCIFENDKKCTNCLDCMTCELDPNKECNNCGRCIEPKSEYNVVKIDGIENE